MVGVQRLLKEEIFQPQGHAQDNWYQVPFLSYINMTFPLSKGGFTVFSQHLEAGGLIPIYRRAN